MLGCTILNHQQHIGLQKLSALAGVTHSSLGPDKHYKFIQDDFSGESALACSCFRILQNLELTCAVGQLVYETIRAHHKLYHTGSGCLLFLAGAWGRVALECLQRGITVGNIILSMSEGMDLCLDVCRRSSVSIKALGAIQSESYGLGLHPSKKPKAQKIKTLKLSRHFCEVESENVSTELQPHQSKHPDIAHIAEGLSHGCAGAMNLVVKASRIQSKNNQDISCSTFDITKVVTCLLPGTPEDSACVLPGCIFLLCAEQASLAHQLQGQHLRVALINGDLSDTYRHLGFKTPKGITCVSEKSDLSSSSKEEEWLEKVVTLLLNLDVQLILVSGLVSENVALRCCRHRILVVEKVKDSALQAFANAAGAVPVTYATQLSKHCVGTGVNIVIWRELSSHDRKPTTAVNICTAGNSELVTVVLTSCVHGKLQSLEDQFWACAYRLHHVLKDNVILPGGGVTEMLCVHHLHKHAEHDVRCPTGEKQNSDQQATPNLYRGVVLHLMADGLIDYISTVMVNTGRFSKVRARTAVSQHLRNYTENFSISAKFSQLFLEGEDVSAVSSAMKSSEGTSPMIYDSLSVKREAWRKALDLVFLVLQTDAEVITGIDQKTDGAPQNPEFAGFTFL
uniref:Uncharacterized protein n=1 Tax=Mola mola TaxID=94237 RepID=A0A3Q3VNG3_MOLML